MDFQSAMETFAEAWVAANTKGGPLGDTSTQSQALALTRNCKSPPSNVPASMCHMKCDSREQSERTHTPIPPSMSVTPLPDTDSVVSPPSVKDGFDKTSSGKSLPVHCVVEAISSLEETRGNHSGQWRRRHAVETDSFVIIPINTPFQELVQAALQRLGYPSESASAAKGSIVMKNWKPLSFDQITDDPVITVGDILGEMTTVATLRIQVFRAKPTIYSDIKDKLLKLLLIQSHGRLLSGECPLDEHILANICRSEGTTMPHHMPEPSEEIRRKFDQWWASQLNPQHLQNTHSALYGIAQAGKAFERPPSLSGMHQEHVHPAIQTVQNQYPTQKTRMRTSFDPELELPKLQRWFADNQHPSRQQIQQYVKELNCLESRRGRKPLDINNVVYWFKNARAAQKRAEIRNISPGLSGHLSANGYNSNSHSPPNGSGLLLSGDGYHQMKSLPSEAFSRNAQMSIMSEDLSMVDSDLEEDDPLESQNRANEEQPPSPTAPLSLTTTPKRDDSENNSSPSLSEPKVEIKMEQKDEPVDLHSSTNHSNSIRTDEEDEESEEKHQIDNCQKDILQNDIERESPRIADMNRHLLRRFNSPNSDPDNSQLMMRGPGENLDRLAAGFPLVPNSMFSHSIMYMSHYIPGLAHGNLAATSPPGSSGISMSALAASAAEERRKRNRTFIDPVTEVPRLEQWFSLNTHPSHNLILKYTEELNCMAYRQKFPRLEPKNVQFWFKNRRAKCKRLKMSLFDNPPPLGQYPHDRE